MQVDSGAGYPGVSSMDIRTNVLPYIAGEEPKVETEAQKILGEFPAGPSKTQISACRRTKVSSSM